MDEAFVYCHRCKKQRKTRYSLSGDEQGKSLVFEFHYLPDTLELCPNSDKEVVKVETPIPSPPQTESVEDGEAGDVVCPRCKKRLQSRIRVSNGTVVFPIHNGKHGQCIKSGLPVKESAYV